MKPPRRPRLKHAGSAGDLVDKVQDCYAALGAIHTIWRHIPNEFDDYIASKVLCFGRHGDLPALTDLSPSYCRGQPGDP